MAAAIAMAPDTDGIVRVTAIVTDRRGQPLAGLKPADFEILVDGKPQTLDTAELTKTPAALPRTFALLLDEFHTAASDSAAIRDALLRFVDQALRPGDVAMVVKPLDSLHTMAPTADRDAIRAAIATFEGRKGDYTARTAFERNYMAQAPTAVAGARAQIVTSALRAIGMTLSDNKNARPAIVLVSDGFERSRSSRDVPANLLTAIRIANRADAPVYAFAPALVPPLPDNTQPADPAFAALTALTTQTGGQLVTGAGELDSGLARMTRDLDAHYVLTYRPSHGSDGRFHALQIGIKRPGAQVRARTGYVAPMSAAERAANTPVSSAPLRVLRRSSLIQSWSGITPTTPGRVNVMVTWEPAVLGAAAPSRPRPASIVITAATPDGTVLFDGAVAHVGAVTAAAGVPTYAIFDAPLGPVRVDMKILDDKGIVIDTDARDITVPARRKTGPTIYPAAVLRTRSAREFRLMASDPHAPAAPAREFRRTERLIIRVAAVDESGQPTHVTGTLLNRLRQPMHTLTAMDDEIAPAITQFDLPLSSLPPGDYSVRLTSTGQTGSTAEYVTFKVVG